VALAVLEGPENAVLRLEPAGRKNLGRRVTAAFSWGPSCS
jgi:hypothetical protein